MMDAAKRSHAIKVAEDNALDLPRGFAAWMADNAHVYDAFEKEALSVAQHREHYSARTIIEFLRHHSLLASAGDGWKLDNDMTPGLARLFALLNPDCRGLFEFRERPHRTDAQEAHA